MINIVFFTTALVLYAASTLCYGLRWLADSRRARQWAAPLLLAAALLHGVAFATRWLESGYPPLTNGFEVFSFFAWGLVLVYLIVEHRSGQAVLGVFVTPLALLSLLIASALPKQIQPLLPVLRSRWLIVHVAISFAAFVTFSLAFVAALTYLLQERVLRHKAGSRWIWRLPALEAMDRLSHRLATLGLLLMTGSLLTGSTWAEQAWGVLWVWQPQQIAALATWVIYLVYLYARHSVGWRGRRLAWLLVAGFISVIVTFVGADLIAPGSLHSFLF